MKKYSAANRRKMGLIALVLGTTTYMVLNLINDHYTIPDFIKGFFEGFSVSIACCGLIILIFTKVKQRNKSALIG